MEYINTNIISITTIILFVTCYLRKIVGLIIGISIIVIFNIVFYKMHNYIIKDYIWFLLILFLLVYLSTSIIKLTTKKINFNTIITKRMFVIPQLLILTGVLIYDYINRIRVIYQDKIIFYILLIISLLIGIILGWFTFSNILLDKYECESIMNKVDGLEQSFDCSPITEE